MSQSERLKGETVRFEVPTAVVMISTVLWDMMPTFRKKVLLSSSETKSNPGKQTSKM
jgi:hypothetical protein